MLLKCYHILHPMVEFGFVIDMQLHEEKSFNIFEMFVRTNESMKLLVNKELQMFRKFHVDVKDIIFPLEWWGKHNFLFPNVIFLICQIFGIVGS